VLATPHISWADVLAGIDEQISRVQSFGIEQGNDELLLIIANVLSALYDVQELIESRLTPESEQFP
jgi:hypothetical protein